MIGGICGGSLGVSLKLEDVLESDVAANGMVDGSGGVDTFNKVLGQDNLLGGDQVDFVENDHVGAGDLAQALADVETVRGVVFFHLLLAEYSIYNTNDTIKSDVAPQTRREFFVMPEHPSDGACRVMTSEVAK